MTTRARNWIIAFAAAAGYSAAQAMQLVVRGVDIPWLLLFLFELPVWGGLVITGPVVFLLARRFPLQGPRTAMNVAVHMVSSIVVIAIQFIITETMRRYVFGPLSVKSGIAHNATAIEYATYTGPFLTDVGRNLISFGLFSLICYFGVVALYLSALNYRELTKAQVRSSQLQSLLSQSQLDALRMQLQPHFLFNTLNTVSSLMSRDVALARRMLARLSDLLTLSIRDFPHHEGPLSVELEFLDGYLEIQDARFGDRLKVVKRIDDGALDAFVPRMILQPLVENAIRHGMKPGDEQLEIVIDARIKDQELIMTVADNGTGPGSQPLAEGLGLKNTRQRLATLFGERQRLDLEPAEGGGLIVKVRIPAAFSRRRDGELETG